MDNILSNFKECASENQHIKLIEKIIADQPKFHAGETEVDREFHISESCLPNYCLQDLAASNLTCYGISEEVIRFLTANIQKGSQTLETGAGCSTLVFAICGAKHIAITPSKNEICRITEYAEKNKIDMCDVKFIKQSSETYLPNCNISDLDFVLIDGKHAFPWPIVDWFFTVDRLNLDGLMMIDDANLRSIGILVEFMMADPSWEFVQNISDYTLVFKKIKEKPLDVAWHMQPWMVNKMPKKYLKRIRRIFIGC